MKTIAVLTSGGDAPGMNAAVRAIVRTAVGQGMAVYGVNRGFEGLISDFMSPLSARDVGGIIQLGGTFLGSARCAEFVTPAGRERALRNLQQRGIQGVVIIGGNGSQQGAYALSQMGMPVVGVASKIDNDLYGSDNTIGLDTALNIALESIDRLRVTASSHQRALLVEVMGRHCGYLALMAGVAGGAEDIVIPERELDPETIGRNLRDAYSRGKKHALIVVAEGAEYNAQKLMAYFKEHGDLFGFQFRVTILGHVQRGGTPTAFDRLLATRLGCAATELLAADRHGLLVGWINGSVQTTPLQEVTSNAKKLDLSMLELAKVLSK